MSRCYTIPRLTAVIALQIMTTVFVSQAALQCYDCTFLVIGSSPSGDPNCVKEVETGGIIPVTCPPDSQFVFHSCQETYVAAVGYFYVRRSCIAAGLVVNNTCMDFVSAGHPGKRCYCSTPSRPCNGNSCIGGLGDCNSATVTTEVIPSTTPSKSGVGVESTGYTLSLGLILIPSLFY